MQQSNFQLVVGAVFGLFALLAILIFSGVLPIFKGSSTTPTGAVTVWGTIPSKTIMPLFNNLMSKNNSLKVTYVEEKTETFESDLLEALAAGTGPDLFLLPQDLIVREENKILLIPFTSFAERDFKNTYIEEGELYLTKGGILGLPLTVDPLVMYWNRDLLSVAGIAEPPKYWDEFLNLAPLLSKRDQSGNLSQSAVSLGEFKNVLYAKDILATLMFQVGNRIVERSPGGAYEVTLGDVPKPGSPRPAEEIFRFYTQFADAAKPAYSWSRSLPASKERFLSEKLAFYFGYASELAELRAKNPHLNFDVASLPQIRNQKIQSVFGRMRAVAISRSAKNVNGAFYLALTMAGKEFTDPLAAALGLPAPRRDSLSTRAADPYIAIFGQAALIAHGWLDPSPKDTDRIFGEAVENTLSGKYRLSEAAITVDQELTNLFKHE